MTSRPPWRSASPFPPPQPDKPAHFLADTHVHLCARFAHSFTSPAQSQPRSALSIRCSRQFFPTKLILPVTTSPWGSSSPVWYYLYIKSLSLFCPLAAILRAASGQVWTAWVHIFVEPVSFTIPHFWKFGLICSIHIQTFASWNPYTEIPSHVTRFSFCLWCWTQISIMALIYHCLQVITMTELFMSLNIYVFHFNQELFIRQRQSLWNKVSLLLVKNDPNISTLFLLTTH